jgi:hypothetical protein
MKESTNLWLLTVRLKRRGHRSNAERTHEPAARWLHRSPSARVPRVRRGPGSRFGPDTFCQATLQHMPGQAPYFEYVIHRYYSNAPIRRRQVDSRMTPA